MKFGINPISPALFGKPWSFLRFRLHSTFILSPGARLRATFDPCATLNRIAKSFGVEEWQQRNKMSGLEHEEYKNGAEWLGP